MEENGNLNELTDKQRRAIAALLSEPTAKQAAIALKVGETTLYRWMSEAAFSCTQRSARPGIRRGACDTAKRFR